MSKNISGNKLTKYKKGNKHKKLIQVTKISPQCLLHPKIHIADIALHTLRQNSAYYTPDSYIHNRAYT